MRFIDLPTQILFYKYQLGRNQWLSVDNINTNYANVIYNNEELYNLCKPVFVIPQNWTYNASGQIVYYSAPSHTIGPYEITLPPNTRIK